MPYVQEIDKKRLLNRNVNTLYSGSGFTIQTKIPKAYLQSNATGQPLLFNEAVEIAGKTSNGGFIDLSTVAQVINDNKDLIQSGISTVGKVVDLGKTISDVSKSYKELEKIKELNKRNKKEKEVKVHVMTPEQEERFMKHMGRGFAKV
jgi:hypothetical protein